MPRVKEVKVMGRRVRLLTTAAIDKLDQAVTWAERNPADWNQLNWFTLIAPGECIDHEREEFPVIVSCATGKRVDDQSLLPASVPVLDCKTACCIAGNLALGDGWKPVWDDDEDPDQEVRYTCFVAKPGHDNVGADHAALMALGIADSDQAAWHPVRAVFAAGNSIVRLREMVDQLRADQAQAYQDWFGY